MINRLNKYFTAWTNFLYKERKEDYYFLGFFRVVIGLFLLVHFLFFMKDFYILYAKDGLINYDVMTSFTSLRLNASFISDFIIERIAVSEYMSYTIICVFYIILSVCLIIGLFTRISSLFFILLHIAIFEGSPLYSYGVDIFSSIALFYCFFFPTNVQFSLDKIIFKKQRRNPGPYRKILQIHLCIVYVSSGFVKLLGEDWRTGEAIWQALHQIRHNVTIPLNFDFLSAFPIVLLLLSWFVVLIELLYPFILFIKKIRPFGITAVICLHLGIAVSLGLYFFSVLMILLTICAFLDLNKEILPMTKKITENV